MFKKIIILIKVLVIASIVSVVSAQTGPPDPPDPGGGGGGSDPVTPIDGGLISILLGGGVAYFVAKRKKAKKLEETGE